MCVSGGGRGGGGGVSPPPPPTHSAHSARDTITDLSEKQGVPTTTEEFCHRMRYKRIFEE